MRSISAHDLPRHGHRNNRWSDRSAFADRRGHQIRRRPWAKPVILEHAKWGIPEEYAVLAQLLALAALFAIAVTGLAIVLSRRRMIPKKKEEKP